MSWLGNLAGTFAGALFPGAKAIVTSLVDQAVVAAVNAGREFVANWIKEAQARGNISSPQETKNEHRNKANDLAAEEAELAEKFKKDKYRTPADEDRIQEIKAERDRLREEMGDINAVQSAKDIADSSNLMSTPASADEFASQVGILSTKQCPKCGGTMTLRFESHSVNQGQKFKWQCTSARAIPCPNIYVKASDLKEQVSVREPNKDLDISKEERKKWSNPKNLEEMAGRVRSHLGDEDDVILCPVHLKSMKLLPMANASGLLLNSYQYVCMCVDSGGKACSHVVPVKSFGQVSGLLNRTEGRGIL